MDSSVWMGRSKPEEMEVSTQVISGDLGGGFHFQLSGKGVGTKHHGPVRTVNCGFQGTQQV